MTAAFFPDDWLARLLLALICYAGALLYGAGFAVQGLRQGPASLLVTLIFFGLFPVTGGTWTLWFLQYSAVIIGIAGIGATQLRFALWRHREVRAYETGTTAGRLSGAMRALIFAPPALVAAYPILITAYGLTADGDWGATADATQGQILMEGVLYLFPVVILFGVYIGLAAWFDRTWLRVVGRIRLLSADKRFVWINTLLGAAAVVCITVILARGPGSPAGRYSLIIILLLTLLPGINALAWTYDAVFRRLLVFHLLLAAAVGLIFGVRAASAGLGLSPAAGWMITLAALAWVIVDLPTRLEAALERWLFPRAEAMRARLMAIAGEALGGATRSAAAADLLQRLVDVLDSEGGMIVVAATPTEPVTMHAVGRVDPGVLGASPSEVAEYVDGVARDGAPLSIESMAGPHQLRLLRAGVLVVCPLVRRRLEATVLLGARRGWIYDTATIQALRLFAAQAGLALENVALAGARAHADKLAALGEAAARIAHEIRNPLTAARSLVQQAQSADGVAELAAPALDELDRIGMLVSDLLAFARRDEAPARQPLPLASVCQQAVKQVAPLAADAGVEIGQVTGDAVVSGDHARLVQVVANLCRNAIEALAEHAAPRRVEVTCRAVNGCGIIEVRDNGPGVAARDLPRLFEPFATTKSAGTGLGLPIARRIVEAHGGRLTVESVPSVETIFRVELPLAGSNQEN